MGARDSGAVGSRRTDLMLEKLGTSSPRSERAADLYDWDELVQEDRIHRLIYTDPAIFQAEMTNIFAAVWVYLGHESQIPGNDDYITVRLGLRPLILLRDSNGKLRALFNRCAHRGTTLCRKDKGSARIFTCPYHGWSYLNTGKLRAVPWPDGYACDFNNPKYNVAQVPRVDSYRGFIFATLNPDAPSLIDYLGAITRPIDEWLDRQPKGLIRVCEANITPRRCGGASAPRRKTFSTSHPRSRSTSTSFPTSRCSATTSRCLSPFPSTRPTSPGTGRPSSTRTRRCTARSMRSTRCACVRRSSSRISAKSTTSPISRKSNAG